MRAMDSIELLSGTVEFAAHNTNVQPTTIATNPIMRWRNALPPAATIDAASRTVSPVSLPEMRCAVVRSQPPAWPA